MAKKDKIVKQYQRERKRIQQFISRAEKRGFEFDENLLPPTPKTITQASVRRLQRLKPDQLYKRSVYINESGKKLKGDVRREQERKESARKAANTRKQLRTEAVNEISAIKNIGVSAPLIENEPDFEERIREEDEANLKRLDEEEFQRIFSEGNIIYKRVLDMINEVDKSHRKAADVLRRTLDQEIENYGGEKALYAIGEAPERFIEAAEVVLSYNPGDNRHDTAIRELMMLIKGSLLNPDEQKLLQDAIDEDVGWE